MNSLSVNEPRARGSFVWKPDGSWQTPPPDVPPMLLWRVMRVILTRPDEEEKDNMNGN